MYNYLFYFLYSYYNKTDKWNTANIPYLSTILVISVLQMFNYLFLRDLISYQIFNEKYSSFKFENLIVPTIFIAIDYWFFQRKNLYKSILNRFSKLPKSEKRKRNILSWLYILVSIVLVIIIGYSIRENLKFWN
ncbi:hypothetical protein SAMN04488552_0216 [Christiangramia echinicola]|uniref:Uncharacterized protein n=1 Tax=Christiangramia echinicola TaxID=279359 RepID=A0A1H1KW80_9FLAO|nr:hypothetical protein SAMN04488552_0216 [Christiangramia echinicola]